MYFVYIIYLHLFINLFGYTRRTILRMVHGSAFYRGFTSNLFQNNSVYKERTIYSFSFNLFFSFLKLEEFFKNSLRFFKFFFHEFKFIYLLLSYSALFQRCFFHTCLSLVKCVSPWGVKYKVCIRADSSFALNVIYKHSHEQSAAAPSPFRQRNTTRECK